MGVVYAATDERLGRPVALKLLAGVDAGGRFRREAAAIARVRHPDIVQIYEVGTAAGRPFLALELVDGRASTAGRPAARSRPGRRRNWWRRWPGPSTPPTGPGWCTGT